MVFVGSKFDTSMIDRERAEMIALGGINLAMTQLTLEQEAAPPDKKLSALAAFLGRVLPSLNRWQTFTLKDEIDGLDGEVKICISCENGKIDINEAFDFKKKKFKPDYEKLIKTLRLTSDRRLGGKTGDLHKKLVEYLKTRNRKIDDLSELIEEPKLEIPKFFYTPPEKNVKRPRASKPNVDLALSDVFTVWGKSEKLEALFLSDALCSILEFRRPAAHDAELRAEKFKSVIKNFNPTLGQNDEKYWKIIRPVYEPKSSFKIKDRKIFSSKFEPKVYSVLSSGKVGAVEQQVLAIIEKVESGTSQKGEPQKKQPKKKLAKKDLAGKKKSEKKTAKKKPFRIIKLYWI
jgi:hypothetical protein